MLGSAPKSFPSRLSSAFSPSSDIRMRARSPWACLTQHLPLSSFLDSSGIYFSQSFRPCFMPLPLIGFSPSEFFPHMTARRPFLARCPLGLTRQRQVWPSILNEAKTQHLSMPLIRSRPEPHSEERCTVTLNESSRRCATGAVVRYRVRPEGLLPRETRWEYRFLDVHV